MAYFHLVMRGSPHGRRRRLAWLAVLLFCGAAGAETQPILSTNAVRHLREAMALMNMDLAETGFRRDMAEPRLALDWIRGSLDRPLDWPPVGDRVLAALTREDRTAGWQLAAGLLETTSAVSNRPAVEASAAWPEALDPVLRDLVADGVSAAGRAAAMLREAFAGLAPAARVDIAAHVLAGTFDAENRPEIRDLLTALGVGPAAVARALAAGAAIDPEPAAEALLQALQGIDMGAILDAAASLDRALSALAAGLGRVRSWPETPLTVSTAHGNVVIGSPGNDTYTLPALLIVDPGGDDTYTGEAGTANGLQGRPVALVADAAGDDRYGSRGLLGAAAALFGIAGVVDLGGEDVYRAAHAAQAAAWFGAAWLDDRAGDDSYHAGRHAQAAATAGAAWLRDGGGNDTYRVDLCGQAYAGVMGFAALTDAAGQDVYTAGGRVPDHERHDDRFLSLSQGFAIGMRPFLGGGVAALVDLAGNDVYVADVYGQGVSYWYSAGMLLDLDGNDSYSVYHYGQGSGIHLSLGLLADGGGHDRYDGFILSQGNAHDLAVGFLVDRAGNDTYTADHYAQGRGIFNALGVLIDHGGRDAYFARRPDMCQGLGHTGDDREGASLGLLLDLGGDADRYTAGVSNATARLRPGYGIVYDWPDPVTAAPAHAVNEPATQRSRTNDTLDALFFDIQRYADTPEKRQAKVLARAEFRARGAAALAWLMDRIGIKNIWVQLTADDLSRRLETEVAVPVLLRYLESDDAEQRRLAAYFLGFHATPEHASRLLPLLDAEKTAGAAIRTLGKWRVTDARGRIEPFLQHDNSWRRVETANALWKLGDPAALPALGAAFEDPVFTVRRAAARAVSAMGAPAERALTAWAREGPVVKRREAIRCLAGFRSRRVIRCLRRLLRDPDAAIRADAALALRVIDPHKAAGWLSGRPEADRSPAAGTRRLP